MTIPIAHKPPKVRVGYEGHDITKPPNWHGLVAMDLLLNNLTTGLFLVAALVDLAGPSSLASTARLAYPIALALLLGDLACLVFDLGSPTRFHHMLRVFKPSSPMSLGTWSLSAYSLPLTAIVALDLAVFLGWLPDSGGVGLARKAILSLGLIPAFGSAAYKGVLFSTSSQPGWKDARWLGGYLVNSALMYGTAGLLGLALIRGDAPAVSRLNPALMVLILSNMLPLGLILAPMGPALATARTRTRFAAVAGLGLLAPLGLLAASTGAIASLAAITALVLGGYALRRGLVRLPHAVHDLPPTDPS